MVKLLATDLDGTLFYPKSRFKLLHSKNVKFLRDFISQGKTLVLVSGRNYHVAEKISKKLDAKIDMIACNGSVIVMDNQIYSDNPMSHEEVSKIYEQHKLDKDIASWVIMTNKYPIVIATEKVGCFKRMLYRIGLKFQGVRQDEFILSNKLFNEILQDEDVKIYKIMALFGITKKSIERARLGAEKFNDAYGTKFEVFWSSQTVEFVNKGVNKSNALKELMNVLKLKSDEVAVVGDSGNDVPLFEEFENSFVMKQAPHQVRAKAKTEIKGVYCIKDYID